MRGPIWLLLVAAALGGCAGLGDLLAPAPIMGPSRTAAAGSEELPAATAQPAPAVKEPVPAPAPPRPTTPAPLATPPTAPTSPPPAAPAPPAPRTAAIPREPPVLAPQASAEEEQRLKTQAERRIEGTEKLVQRIDPARLPREQQENYRTIQSFLVKAREALSSRDVQRAFTLADKAYFLADEMSKAPR
jgi:outer membrane biosynthesis protein TonB